MLKQFNIEKLIGRIKNYLKGNLSNQERHELEKEINSDPFLSDAMDGFSELNIDDLEHDLNALNKRLKAQHVPIRRLNYKAIIKIAASITLIVGIGSVTYFYIVPNITPQKIAKQESEVATKEKSNIDNLIAEPAQITEETKTSENLNIGKNATTTIEDSKIEKDNTEAPKGQEITNKPAIAKIKVAQDQSEIATDTEALEAEATIMIAEEISQPKQVEKELSETSGAYEQNDTKLEGTVLKGRIIDATTNEAIPFANIATENESGVIADFDGNFNINLTNDSILKVSYVGYKTTEIALNENTESIEIKLEQDLVAIEEVQTLSYTKQREKNFESQSQSKGSLFKMNKKKSSGEMVKAGDVKFDMAPRDTATGLAIQNIMITYYSEITQHSLPEGGIDKFEAYILNKKTKRQGDPHRVNVDFVIDKKGRFIAFEIENTDDIYANELIRLLKEGPKWIPAINDSTPINDTVNISVLF